MEKILHIITGGTILGQVPEYGEVGELANIFNNTIDVKKYLTKSLKIDVEVEEREICLKDSRDITDIDRKMMQTSIEQAFDGGGQTIFNHTWNLYNARHRNIFEK